ncbi:16S rRNA (guanine966-N2)-methyltransferase [Isoptericola variabilis J7]|uniref:RsmD family RNA methyltransferase n=1 Tax=Isoptericola variabilis TaxID=139208 RepID=UPI0011AA6596|nr:RsmD family RNA methyltransferase [Isoptericola variabilis]TWH31657.1 16S rRNA (guanine966-N2)-methyltransferase [Isoptericola variabilis J7]
MTRIVAGTVGGRTIAVPPKGTRPTSDRVREAIFSRLEHLDVLDGGRVLDLFAGSGALGLEAATRRAADVARRNVADLGLTGTVRVVADTAERYSAGAVGPFDVVFLDPPYDLAEPALAVVLEHLAAPGVLARGAVVVVERSTRSPEPTWPAGLEPFARKDYGETAVHYAEPTA